MKPRITLPGAWLYLGDAVTVLAELPKQSVHVCVTSPPYFALRRYETGDNKKHEIGSEEMSPEFVARLVRVFAGVKRVLHDDGTLWLNIGDTYGGDGDGQMMGIPWKVATALQADGWLLRAEFQWVKMAPMPESVTGWRWERCRVKVKSQLPVQYGKSINSDAAQILAGLRARPGENTEWKDCPGCSKCASNGGLVLRKGRWRPTRATESIFLFTKTNSYFCDQINGRQPARSSTLMRDRYTRVLDDPDEQFAVQHDHETVSEDGNANLRNWVLFKSQNEKMNHYACFPPALPTLAIKVGTSDRGVCSYCGAPWCRIVQQLQGEDQEWKQSVNPSQKMLDGQGKGICSIGSSGLNRGSKEDYEKNKIKTKTLDWRPTCSCPVHQPVPAVVLDPFLGSGTTVAAALKCKRRGIGIELSQIYLETIARKKVERALRNKGLGLT